MSTTPKSVIITKGSSSLDIAPYLKAESGWAPGRNDIDGPNAGREVLSGDLIRDLLTTKRTIDCNFVPIPKTVLQNILNIVDGEFFECTYDDEQYGVVTKTFMTNNFTWPRAFYAAGQDWYNLTFKMTEK